MFLGPASLFKFPIFLRQSDQEEKKEAPPSKPQETVKTEQSRPSDQTDSECKGKRIVAFMGDAQFHEPGLQTAIRSLLVQSRGPGHRLPGSNEPISHFLQALMKQVVPKGKLACFDGIFSTGDEADVADIRELQSYIRAMETLRAVDPRYRLRSAITSNHNACHTGVLCAGKEFGGIPAFFLRLEGKRRTYRKDIHGKEVGGVKNILDKEGSVVELHRFLHGRELKAVTLHPSEVYEYSYLGGERVGRKAKRLPFERVWQQERDGSLTSYVHVKRPDDEIRRPEQKYIYTSAVRLKTVETANGPQSVIVIGVDSMDRTELGSNFLSTAAVFGHISSVNVEIIDSLIRHNPNARFLIEVHYPLEDIPDILGIPDIPDIPDILDILATLEAGSSGFGPKILSNPRVIGVIAAHTHKPGFIADLRAGKLGEKLGIRGRKTPLPQITVPANIDYPNQMVVMEYGVDEDDPRQITFKFRFVGIDERKLPGSESEHPVRQAMREEAPYLLTYLDAMRHFKDARYVHLANPATDLYDQVYLFGSADYGIAPDPGRINDQVVVNDVIPANVADAKSYVRLAIRVVWLTLMEAGLKKEADRFLKEYRAKLEDLVGYYEGIWKGKFPNRREIHKRLERIDRHNQGLASLNEEVLQKLKASLTTGPEGPNRSRNEAFFENTEHIVNSLPLLLEAYKAWLVHYEQNQWTEAGPGEMIDEANLLGNPYFSDILAHVQGLPSDSYAGAFMVHVGLESARQVHEFYTHLRSKGKPDSWESTPETIWVRVATDTGEVSVTHSARTVPSKVPYIWWDPTKDWNLEAPTSADIKKAAGAKPGVMRHWALQMGPYLERGAGRLAPEGLGLSESESFNYGLSLRFGGQWHLIDNKDKLRLNLRFGGGIDAARQVWRFKSTDPEGRRVTNELTTYGASFPLQVSGTVGDRFGWSEVGPLLRGGIEFRGELFNPDYSSNLFIGLGIQAGILEQLVSLEAAHSWYKDGFSAWRFTLYGDVFRLFSQLNLLPRHF